MAASVTVIAVGRLGPGPELDLCDAYARRLGAAVHILEIDDRKAPGRGRKAWEAERILAALPKAAYLVALDERGEHVNSRDLATWFGKKRDQGETLAFVIGGPDGLDGSVLEKAQLKLAFGKMTWPHKLARVMLLEQIYRTGTILSGHPYHRD